MPNEPSLKPPVDRELERISEYVDDLTLKNLVDEIQSYGLDEKVKETILELEIPNANDFMQEVVMYSNLHFLIKLISNKTINEIREILIDHLYWKEKREI